MIEILDEAWHGSPKSIMSPMISGMACFVNTYYGKYNKKRLVEKLQDPTALGSIISGGSSGSRKGEKKYAEEIASVYNGNISENSPNYLK
mgnify:CR=1 FL=1